MRHRVNLSLSGMEEVHFILIMVLRNIKKDKTDKIKNEEPEMVPEITEEEPVEEVEEKVFNHPQQQQRNSQQQFQPNDES